MGQPFQFQFKVIFRIKVLKIILNIVLVGILLTHYEDEITVIEL